MLQDILTYITLTSALIYIIYKLYGTISSILIRKETECSSCSCGPSVKNHGKNKPVLAGKVFPLRR